MEVHIVGVVFIIFALLFWLFGLFLIGSYYEYKKRKGQF